MKAIVLPWGGRLDPAGGEEVCGTVMEIRFRETSLPH